MIKHPQEQIIRRPAILRQDLAFEPIHFGQIGRLMVSSIKENASWVVQLEGHESQHDFDGKGAAVDKITVEEVRVGGGRVAVHGENVQ